MSVSLYDLLDVDEDATPDQIRVAWKAAIADLDPTDRKFRAYNDAAGVLLDPDKRAAYDAELAAGRSDAGEEPSAAEPELVVPASPAVTRPETESETETETETETEAEPTPAEPTPAGPSGADDTAAGPPTWLVLGAAFVAALCLAFAVVVLTWPGSWGDPSPADQEEQAQVAEEAGSTAEGAAERAVPVVLSYDYRTLDDDFTEAEQYLTDDFAAKRTELFDEQGEAGQTLREQVVADKVVVTALVSGTGLTRVSDDGSKATVVVYVDQDSQKGDEAPRSLRMWATLSMVREDGNWLISDICTEDDCS